MTSTASKICQVTPTILMQCLEVCVQARRPAFTWGHPGTAKSDVHRQLAKKLMGFLIDLRASQWDAVDTRGIPYLTDKKGTRWAIPEIFPTAEFAAQHPVVIVFLDELNAAPPSVQAALYQLILDRRLGDYVLPDNVVILAAGNLETDRAVTHRMATPLADRFFHFELIVDPKGWEKWALTDGDIEIEIISYLRWRPEHLYLWEADSTSKAQATLRGWEYLSDALKVMKQSGTNGPVESAMYAAKVGEAVGAEFFGFLKIFRKLPDPDGVLLNPTTVEIPTDIAVNYALCGAVAERASVENMGRLVQFANRLTPEFNVLLVRTAADRHPEVHQTKAFMEWCEANTNVQI